MPRNNQKIMQRKVISATERINKDNLLSKNQSSINWLWRKSSNSLRLWIERKPCWKSYHRRDSQGIWNSKNLSHWRKGKKNSGNFQLLCYRKFYCPERRRKKDQLRHGNHQFYEGRSKHFLLVSKIILPHYFRSGNRQSWYSFGHYRWFIQKPSPRVYFSLNKSHFTSWWSRTWKVSAFTICSWTTSSQHICQCASSKYSWTYSNFKPRRQWPIIGSRGFHFGRQWNLRNWWIWQGNRHFFAPWSHGTANDIDCKGRNYLPTEKQSCDFGFRKSSSWMLQQRKIFQRKHQNIERDSVQIWLNLFAIRQARPWPR